MKRSVLPKPHSEIPIKIPLLSRNWQADSDIYAEM